MALTETKIKNAKAQDKIYKIYDERGLYLEVPPSGAKRWRFKYRFTDKEKRISLGTYPEISLKEARDRREAARAEVPRALTLQLHARLGCPSCPMGQLLANRLKPSSLRMLHHG